MGGRAILTEPYFLDSHQMGSFLELLLCFYPRLIPIGTGVFELVRRLWPMRSLQMLSETRLEVVAWSEDAERLACMHELAFLTSDANYGLAVPPYHRFLLVPRDDCS